MKTPYKLMTLVAVMTAITNLSCDKYLEEPSNKNLSVITSLDDIQALLNNYSSLNYTGANSQEVSADDYYINDADFASLSYETSQRMYTWQKSNIFRDGANNNDWNYLYRNIYASNTALEESAKLESTSVDKAALNNVKGQALVFRAASFLEAVQIWSPAYDKSTASSDKGIPLRLISDFNEKSIRASVEEVYSHIISDLKQAVQYLPATQISVHRPSKAAAYGLLARTHLWMRDYEKAGLYADSCLKIYSTLINYNNLKPADAYPIKAQNAEVIFEKGSSLGEVLAIGRACIHLSHYNSYAGNDLRKSILFTSNSNGTISFKGYYLGSPVVYTGITTNEMYLTRAECFARANKIAEALADLNTLLATRWKTGTYIKLAASDNMQALGFILQERRKDLLFRGLRWMDIKRLNKEGANISLSRIVNGTSYNLASNDAGFALPLPEDIEVFFRD